jgi:hypothetical protein
LVPATATAAAAAAPQRCEGGAQIFVQLEQQGLRAVLVGGQQVEAVC